MGIKNYRIKYLRMGEWTMATNKNGEMMQFPSVAAIHSYMNKAREDEPNNPVTFMNRITICEYSGNDFVCKVEEY